MSSVKIISLNTRGTLKKYEKIITEIKNNDIIMLQEQHIDKNANIIKRFEQDTNCHIFYTTNEINKLSIITLAKKSTFETKIEEEIIIKGRALNIIITENGKKYNIVNIYAPAKQGERLNFFAKLYDKIKQMNNIILGGDLNVVLKKEDTNGILIEKNYMRFVNYMINNMSLIDPHENINNTTIKYTFTASNKKIRKRLDRYLISNILRNRIKNYTIQPNSFSDHDAIKLEIDMGKRKKWGRGTWKLNCEILNNQNYNEYITEIIRIEIEKKNNYPSQSKWWDNLKLKIKKETITFCIKTSKMKDKNTNILKTEIIKVQSEIDRDINIDKNIEYMGNLKERLNNIEDEKLRGAKIRAKIVDIEEGGKSTRYFFSKESARGTRKQIRTLIDKHNKTLDKEEDIMTETKSFYTDLYKTENIDKEQMHKYLETVTDRIEPQDLEDINNFITESEIKTALKEMKKNRSPGEDGLTKEFYEKFDFLLIDEIGILLNNIIWEHKIPDSQKNAIVTLIYKKGDHRHLKNWRPVSLLNVDYKLLSKILANRMKKFIHKIVPENQKCGVKDRNITDILIIIDSIIENFENSQQGAAIMTLDQEKAFDRINHAFLFGLLTKLGFEGNIKIWIEAMYTNITSQIEINGKLTSKILVERSVRQGCPLSMILFVLTTIPLINMIETNVDIKGIKTMYNNEIKILAYADDTTICISDIKSILKTIEIYNIHASASESKLNSAKTEILKLGNWKNKKPLEEYKKYVKEEIKVLGGNFCSKKSNSGKINWEMKIEKIKKLIQSFEKRNLSIVGKVLLANTMLLSQIWHLAAILPLELKYIHKINKLINIWINGKNGENIHTLLTKSKEQGGLGLIDLEKRIKSIKQNLCIS